MTLNEVMAVIDKAQKYQDDDRHGHVYIHPIREAVSRFAAAIEADSWKLPDSKEAK